MSDKSTFTKDGFGEEAGRFRRPYSPPTVLETSAFETLALSCGKESAQAGCDPFGTGDNLSAS
jgi:hypothetical protein